MDIHIDIWTCFTRMDVFGLAFRCDGNFRRLDITHRVRWGEERTPIYSSGVTR